MIRALGLVVRKEKVPSPSTHVFTDSSPFIKMPPPYTSSPFALSTIFPFIKIDSYS